MCTCKRVSTAPAVPHMLGEQFVCAARRVGIPPHINVPEDGITGSESHQNLQPAVATGISRHPHTVDSEQVVGQARTWLRAQGLACTSCQCLFADSALQHGNCQHKLPTRWAFRYHGQGE